MIMRTILGMNSRSRDVSQRISRELSDTFASQVRTTDKQTITQSLRELHAADSNSSLDSEEQFLKVHNERVSQYTHEDVVGFSTKIKTTESNSKKRTTTEGSSKNASKHMT